MLGAAAVLQPCPAPGGNVIAVPAAWWDKAPASHRHVPSIFWAENVCARGDAALPCQRPGRVLLGMRVNKADCQDNPFPHGVCGFISIFLQNEMKCGGVSAVKINHFVLS